MELEIKCSKDYLEEAKKKIKIIVFDLDGTLTKVDSIWRYIHEKFGVWDKAKKYKDMFFQGKITYEEWAILDAELWKGRTLEEFIEIAEEVPLMDGLDDVLDYLSKKYKIIILSSGLDILKYRFKDKKIDKFISNRMKFEDNVFKGEIEVFVEHDNKDKVLNEILKEYNLGFENTATIGDAENDIPMMKKAALAIAVNPKSRKVEEVSHVILRGQSLTPLKTVL